MTRRTDMLYYDQLVLAAAFDSKWRECKECNSCEQLLECKAFTRLARLLEEVCCPTLPTDKNAGRYENHRYADESPVEWMDRMFERTNRGWRVYKTFGRVYASPPEWDIRAGSTIVEGNLDMNNVQVCGAGINFATEDWQRGEREYEYALWECIVPFNATVIVPWETDGKARTDRLVILGVYIEAIDDDEDDDPCDGCEDVCEGCPYA
jgi:hypothetical protein